MAMKPPIHGRDHCPGGSDPIPCISSARPEWSNPIHCSILEQAASEFLFTSVGGTRWVYVADSTAPYGAYVQTTGDTHFFDTMLNIGPQNSQWMVHVICQGGSDFGKLEIHLGTVAYLTVGDYDLETVNNVTYVLMEVGGFGGGVKDCYSVAASDKSFTAGGFIIRGDPGVKGTTFTNVGGAHLDWNGGPGPHRLRIKLNGKNASSSGFRGRVSSIALTRRDETAH